MSKPNKLSRWKIVWIPTSMIDVVWAKAQRGYDAKKARAIADTFDPDLLDPIVVSLPNADGKHHCIDGQHRLGAVRLALGDDQSVPCRVVAAADPQRAADIFVQLQTRRTAPAAIDRFIVSVTAGYEVETAVNGILRDLGYKASRGKTPGCLGAIDCCVSVYRRMGGDTLRLALATIKATWGLNAGAVDSGIVNGYARFVARFHDRADLDRLADRVAKNYAPGRIIGAAKTARETFHGSIGENVERLLISTYNKGLRSGHLPLHSDRES